MPVDPFLKAVQDLENPGNQESSDPFQDEVTDPFEEEEVSEQDAALVNELLEAQQQQEAAENSKTDEAIVSVDPGGDVDTSDSQLNTVFNPLFLLALIPVLALVLFICLRKPQNKSYRRLDRKPGHEPRQRFREKVPPNFDDQPIADSTHEASGPRSDPGIPDPSVVAPSTDKSPPQYGC